MNRNVDDVDWALLTAKIKEVSSVVFSVRRVLIFCYSMQRSHRWHNHAQTFILNSMSRRTQESVRNVYKQQSAHVFRKHLHLRRHPQPSGKSVGTPPATAAVMIHSPILLLLSAQGLPLFSTKYTPIILRISTNKSMLCAIGHKATLPETNTMH